MRGVRTVSIPAGGSSWEGGGLKTEEGSKELQSRRKKKKGGLWGGRVNHPFQEGGIGGNLETKNGDSVV